ncbi:MAG: 2-amino-4-hydroxy-6-hydroxymethyldihydropteridine diphosphokinase [Prevotella sp.]|nr:2-amino-4-hydroxy-6-hydroxymethyldihydropteridine diphosphokinase [Prevotella sp.]
MVTLCSSWTIERFIIEELKHTVFLGLGTNLGNREENIRRAIELIGERVGNVERQSSLCETEPWGFRSENLFLNAVVMVKTQLSPTELLETTQGIERYMGRKPNLSPGQYHDRPIDIDILLYDDITIDMPNLKIPHPLMKERDFVMIPLREVLGEEAK